MEDGYSLGLCLLDFVPNLAFIIGGFFLYSVARLGKRRYPIITIGLGTLLVFLGGTLKAIWKLLFTLRVADIQIMSNAQFILDAPGFLLMFLGVIALARDLRLHPQTALAAMAVWKMPFLLVMTVCSLGMYGILSYLGFRRRAPLAGVLFVLAIVFTLGMAGMASAPQTVSMQWVEEGINSAGQIAFAFGAYLLYRRVRVGVGR